MAAGIEEGAVRRELFRRRKERESINRRRGHGMRTLFAAKLQRPAFRRIELRRAAGGDSDLTREACAIGWSFSSPYRSAITR